jgi:hypothetical protein
MMLSDLSSSSFSLKVIASFEQRSYIRIWIVFVWLEKDTLALPKRVSLLSHGNLRHRRQPVFYGDLITVNNVSQLGPPSRILFAQVSQCVITRGLGLIPIRRLHTPSAHLTTSLSVEMGPGVTLPSASSASSS